MDTMKKNWPQVVAVSVVAIALGFYIIKNNKDSKMKAHVITDCAQFDKDMWPAPRRIIDCDAKQFVQQKQLDLWLKNGLQKFIE